MGIKQQDNINLLPSLAHLNLRKHLSQENAIPEAVFRNSLTANNGVDSSISTWSGGYPQVKTTIRFTPALATFREKAGISLAVLSVP